MHERVKERDRDIRLSRTQPFLNTPIRPGVIRYPHWYSRRVKEVTRTRLHHNNINRDSGIEFPDAWMLTIRQVSSRPLPQRTAEETVPSPDNANDALDRSPPTMSAVRDTPITNNHGGITSSTQ